MMHEFQKCKAISYYPKTNCINLRAICMPQCLWVRGREIIQIQGKTFWLQLPPGLQFVMILGSRGLDSLSRLADLA